MKKINGMLMAIKETFKKDEKGKRTNEKNGYQLNFFSGNDTITVFTKEEINKSFLNQFVTITAIETNIQTIKKMNEEEKKKHLSKVEDEEESIIIDYIDNVKIKKVLLNEEFKIWNNEERKMEVKKFNGLLVQVKNEENGNIGRMKVMVKDAKEYINELKSLIGKECHIIIKDTIKQPKSGTILISNYKAINIKK